MSVNPGDCARKVVDVYGAEGVKWLDRLPTIISDCAARWSLSVLPPFAPLSYHYVAPAVREDGTEVVLKVGVPGQELDKEIEALRLFNGSGIVRLLDADPEEGVLLLERLKPGTPLSSLDDDEKATQIAAQVMRSLWRPAPVEHPFSTVAEWAADLKKMRAYFDGGCGPFPSVLVEKAERLLDQLIGSMTEPVLIHGDLHHGNILRGEREPWLALDPKGVVGAPLFDVAYFCQSELLEQAQPKRVLKRRVDQLAEELGVDRTRIVNWGLALGVLTGWWSFEDHHGHGYDSSIGCAELFDELRQRED